MSSKVGNCICCLRENMTLPDGKHCGYCYSRLRYLAPQEWPAKYTEIRRAFAEGTAKRRRPRKNKPLKRTEPLPESEPIPDDNGARRITLIFADHDMEIYRLIEENAKQSRRRVEDQIMCLLETSLEDQIIERT